MYHNDEPITFHEVLFMLAAILLSFFGIITLVSFQNNEITLKEYQELNKLEQDMPETAGIIKKAFGDKKITRSEFDKIMDFKEWVIREDAETAEFLERTK